MKKLSLEELNHFFTISEYAKLCGVKRYTIDLRIKHKTKPLPVVEVSSEDLLEKLNTEEAKDILESRSSLRKSVMDRVANEAPVRMINIRTHPPIRRRRIGRPAVHKKIVGKVTQDVIAEAKSLGYELHRKSFGYELYPEGNPTKSVHYDNLPSVRFALVVILAESIDHVVTKTGRGYQLAPIGTAIPSNVYYNLKELKNTLNGLINVANAEVE